MAATPYWSASQATVTFWVRGGVQPQAAVAGHESVAGEFVAHARLPPVQVYAGVEAAVPQAEGQTGAVQVPVGYTQVSLTYVELEGVTGVPKVQAG